MMLALGMFVFMRQTLPHQTMQRESDYRWPSNSRTGRADIYTETPVRVSGFKRVIDEQDWTITKVTHFLNNSGFTTSLELEVRLSDVEYETEDYE
ncbi:phage P2 GpU family protein [Escherichia coli 2-316-03_S4_C2]|nr:phage P2 GpU family protein [Escherichia coli 2-316-03_S4_C2]